MNKNTKDKLFEHFIKRPLFISLLFLCTGIILGHSFYRTFYVLAPLSILLCIFLCKICRTKIPLIFPILFIIGYFSVIGSLSVKNYTINTFAYSGSEFQIQGSVTNISLTRSGRQRLTFNTHTFYVNGNIIPQNMRIQAILGYEQYASIGQNLTLYGNLSPLRRPSFPGGFDQFQFLRARGIHYTMFPRNVYFGETVIGLNNILQDFRRNLINIFNENLPPNEAALMSSIILGDRTNIEPEVLDAFRAAGLYHILVVSGLHLSILFMAINSLLGKVLSVKKSASITLIIIALYALMIGGISITRASFMAGVMVFGKLFNRERDFVTTISFAAICLLFYEPLYLFDIGFILSFGAVYAIAFGTKPVQKVLNIAIMRLPFINTKLKNKEVVTSISVTIAIFFILAPIFTYFFYQIRPYDIITNILLMVSVNVLVILGFIVAFIGLFFTDISLFLSGGLYIITRSYIGIAMFVYSLPNSLITIGRPSILSIILYYVLLASLFLLINNYTPKVHKEIPLSKENKQTNKLYKTCVAICFITFVSTIFLGMGYDGLRVTYLDVGHGKAVVITTGKQTYIIDGGGNRLREIGENTGVNILIPYLMYRGINNINAVFVTHEDEDHIIGIIELLRYSNKNVHRIYTTKGLDMEHPLSIKLFHEANLQNIPISFIHAPNIFTSDNLTMEVIYPFYDTFFRTINSTSLVLRLVYNNTSFLFTSDIGHISEKEILENGINISSDVLTIAHHGSRFSSYGPFVEAVDPLVAVVKTSLNNPHGHPTPQVTNMLQQKGIPLYNTAIHDTIIITVRGNNINLKTMR